MHYLDTLLAVIIRHSEMAYGAVFLISFFESLVLVGLLVPGTVIMFGIGAVVATGSLGLTPVLLLAVAGAVAGDGVSYWLGHRYKKRLRNVRPFSRYLEMLKKGDAFFQQHGGKSVLFGRFVGPLRPVIPAVAGMMGMRPAHFAVVNVLSAVGWALVYILPGVFFGTSLAVAGTVSTRLAVVVFILAASIWGFVRGCRKAVSFFEKKIPAWLFALRRWATGKTSSHLVARAFQRFFLFLFFRSQGEEVLVAFLTLALFIAAWGFLGVLQDVLAKDPLVIVDQAVYHFFQSIRTFWADNFFVLITELGDTFINLSLAGAVLLVLLAGRCYRTAGFWMLTLIGGLLGVQALKWAIHLPRPVAIYHGASAYGFPSGHTTMSVVFYGFLAILLAGKLSGGWRWGLFSSVILVSFFIGFSRLYLGAHWLSDVLGGYFIGTSWTALMGIAYLKGADDRIPRRLLAAAVFLAMVIAGGWHVIQSHAKDMVFYAPRHAKKTIAFSSWQNDGWRDLPARRIDMEGEPEQPLTVQWAGSPDELAGFLRQKGWGPPPLLSLKHFLGVLSGDMSVGELPVLPRLHDGRPECLRLVRMGRKRRLVLYLWATDVQTAGTGTPLYIGTIEVQKGRRLAGLITLARDTGEYEYALDVLEETFSQRWGLRRVRRSDNEIRADHERLWPLWRGGVLLAWNVGRFSRNIILLKRESELL